MDDPAAVTAKQPIPSPRDQARAEQTIRQLFAGEYASHAPAGKDGLAKKLLDQGSATAGDLAARYVSFREARDLLVGDFSGDFPFM